uniref:C-type lectin receptor-like tyrosine-protein kinase At1g52310 n=1 Tax=Rhizophora mucronata TaxID=61149 RepID=A0A2P2L3L5_RHIMU
MKFFKQMALSLVPCPSYLKHKLILDENKHTLSERQQHDYNENVSVHWSRRQFYALASRYTAKSMPTLNNWDKIANADI